MILDERDKSEGINNEKQEERKNPMYFVNPEIIMQNLKIIQHMKKAVCQCPVNLLKLIDQIKCHIKYLDYNGQPKELLADGMLATCIQHEMDHLEGILFIDYLSKLKRSMIVKKLVKQKEQLDRIVI